MAIYIDETQMADENAYEFEKRLNSSLMRFSDKTPIPVDYFHVNNAETTADAGFETVEEILGNRSPYRFRKISNFPIYMESPINLDLGDSEIGLDNSFEAEAVILPGTIRPLQNDHILIKQLHDSYIFRVTEVQQDNVHPDNYYNIKFVLEYIDGEKKEELENQTNEKFSCVIENIGTEDKCIFEDGYKEEIDAVENMYNEMLTNYTTFFYSQKYNCLLADWEDGFKLHDPLQNEFIMKHKLFHIKNRLDNIVLAEQFTDPKRTLKYEKSIYRFFETRSMVKLNRFPFTTFIGLNNKQTGFARWHDSKVRILDIPSKMDPNSPTLLSQESEGILRMGYPTESKFLSLMKNYIRDPEIPITEIDLELGNEMLAMDDANIEMFFFVPIVLFIIKESLNFARKKEIRTI